MWRRLLSSTRVLGRLCAYVRVFQIARASSRARTFEAICSLVVDLRWDRTARNDQPPVLLLLAPPPPHLITPARGHTEIGAAIARTRAFIDTHARARRSVRFGKIASLSSRSDASAFSSSRSNSPDKLAVTLPSTTATPRSSASPSARSPLHAVQPPGTVTDEELELELASTHTTTVLPPLVFPDDRKLPKQEQWDTVAMESDHDTTTPLPGSAETATSPRPRSLLSSSSVRSMYQKKQSTNEFHLSSPTLVTAVVTGDGVELSSPRVLMRAHTRRATVSVESVSHHALERLGVSEDILKKEKGMKKLGISDVDIERSEELRRYTGIPTKKMGRNKVELVFGFSDEQLHRDKAVKRLGTTEQEILDDYSRRVSMLGRHDRPMTTF